MLIDLRGQLFALKLGELGVYFGKASTDGFLIFARELPQRRIAFEDLFRPEIYQAQ
ncbi:hypothetical protein D9M68_894950 [compost metagenome]